MKIQDIKLYKDGGSIDFEYKEIKYYIDRAIGSDTKFNVFLGKSDYGGFLIKNQILFLETLKEDIKNQNCFVISENKEPNYESLISLIDESLEYQYNTHNNMIPEKGKTYYYFDDGKILVNRRDIVKITKVVPFSDMDDNHVMEKWKETVELSDHLIKPVTDYFVCGVLELGNQELIFVRTKNNGWFSFNNYMWNGIFGDKFEEIDGSDNSLYDCLETLFKDDRLLDLINLGKNKC